MITAALKRSLRIEFDGGYLRALKPEDVHHGYIDGLNDPEVNRFLVGVRRRTQTIDTVVQFVQKNLKTDSEILLGVWEHGVETHCGTVRLHGVESLHSTAHIGICLFDKKVWGRRIATKVIQAVTQWAIEKLDLRWVEAGAYGENTASQKAFLAAGYEWVYDVSGKYIFEGSPAVVKVYAARRGSFHAAD